MLCVMFVNGVRKQHSNLGLQNYMNYLLQELTVNDSLQYKRLFVSIVPWAEFANTYYLVTYASMLNKQHQPFRDEYFPKWFIMTDIRPGTSVMESLSFICCKTIGFA